MPAIAPPLAISAEDLHTLGQWSRSGSIRAALGERAKILLLAAQGLSSTEIAGQVGCSRPTVILWRHRYTKATGLANLPFDAWRRNVVWLELVLCAQDLTCWLQSLLLDGELALAAAFVRLRTLLLAPG